MKHVEFETLPDVALVRRGQILPLLPFGSQTLWRRMRDGRFPAPALQEPGMCAWRWGDVRKWLEGAEA